ncbi:hypothetical protein EON68_02290 [archaeon]|nr:MAG: hypothetical protein EON68_02290 [archaeon]
MECTISARCSAGVRRRQDWGTAGNEFCTPAHDEAEDAALERARRAADDAREASLMCWGTKVTPPTRPSSPTHDPCIAYFSAQ